MSFYAAVLILLILYRIRLQPWNDDYMSIEQNNIIKGIFTWLIFASHFGQYADINTKWDTLYQIWGKRGGQLVVTLFLFYSGYGILYSIRKKGVSYVKRMPLDRILKVELHFALAVVLYIILQLFRGRTYGIKHLLLSLIGWESVGNSNWYIFAILVLYIIVWFSFRCLEGKEKGALIGCTLLTILGMFFVAQYKSNYWYNTWLCFPAGMWFCCYREQVEAFLKEKKRYAFSLVTLGLCFIACYRLRGNILWYSLWCLSFVGLVVLFTMKARLGSRILEVTGKNLFGLYIMQRICMIALSDTPAAEHTYLYAAICFAAMYVLGIGFEKVCGLLDRAVYGKLMPAIRNWL